MSADIFLLPNRAPKPVAGRVEVRFVIGEKDAARLDWFAGTLGISRGDAAGRMLCNALRLHVPPDANEGEG